MYNAVLQTRASFISRAAWSYPSKSVPISALTTFYRVVQLCKGVGRKVYSLSYFTQAKIRKLYWTRANTSIRRRIRRLILIWFSLFSWCKLFSFAHSLLSFMQSLCLRTGQARITSFKGSILMENTPPLSSSLISSYWRAGSHSTLSFSLRWERLSTASLSNGIIAWCQWTLRRASSSTAASNLCNYQNSLARSNICSATRLAHSLKTT